MSRRKPAPRHVAVAWALLLGGSAQAEGTSALSLHWDAPASCPDARSVEREVARRLGDSSPANTVLIARARVREMPPGKWLLELDTEQNGVRGARTIEGNSCEGIAATVATILALAIDPDRAKAQPPPGVTPRPSPTEPQPPSLSPAFPQPSPQPSQPQSQQSQQSQQSSQPSPPQSVERLPASPEPSPAEPSASAAAAFSPAQPWRLSASAQAEGGLLFGVLGTARPTVGLGMGLGLGVGSGATPPRNRVSVSLVGSYGFEQTVEVAEQVEVALQLAAVRLNGCYSMLAAGPFSAAPCVGVSASHAWGTGSAKSAATFQPKNNSISWIAAEAGVLLSVRVAGPRLRAWLDGAAVVPLRRPTVYVEGASPGRQLSALQGRVCAGLAIDVW